MKDHISVIEIPISFANFCFICRIEANSAGLLFYNQLAKSIGLELSYFTGQSYPNVFDLIEFLVVGLISAASDIANPSSAASEFTHELACHYDALSFQQMDEADFQQDPSGLMSAFTQNWDLIKAALPVILERARNYEFASLLFNVISLCIERFNFIIGGIVGLFAQIK